MISIVLILSANDGHNFDDVTGNNYDYNQVDYNDDHGDDDNHDDDDKDHL